MSAVRQDAWTEENDMILAEVTLRHIRDGGTQLSAFEEVGEKIGRTAAACGFRWNSFVRKKYDEAIRIAKAQRQKRTRVRRHGGGLSAPSAAEVQLNDSGYARSEVLNEESITIDAVIRYLRQWKMTHSDLSRKIRVLEKALAEVTDEADALRRENKKLSAHVSEVASDYRTVNDDYKALIQIMDRARKLAILQEEDQEAKSKFKVDADGNLQRID